MVLPRFYYLLGGGKLPSIGLGTYMMQGDVLKLALDYALHLGYRHVDTAATYRNEAEIGEVIADRIKAGKLSRRNVFVTTKIPSDCLSKADCVESAQKSLDRLKVKYVDMFLIHSPWGHRNNDFVQTWQALENLKKCGYVSHLGVSNFTTGQIEKIISNATYPPENLQLECHPYYQQHTLKKFCDLHKIVVTAYSPIGASDNQFLHRNKSEVLTHEPLVQRVASEYKKTPVQILLNFLLCRGFAVVPKSSSPERLEENLHALNFQISEEDVKGFYSLDRRMKFYQFSDSRHHPDYHPNEF